ncbi:MAG: hypothetical protein M3451_11895 [Chloroflexota bacterium]|nr:hypothetical protein [Chloroflexota bacterium]
MNGFRLFCGLQMTEALANVCQRPGSESRTTARWDSTPQSFGQLVAVSPHWGVHFPSPHLPQARRTDSTTPQSFGQFFAVSPHCTAQNPSPQRPQAATATPDVCTVSHAALPVIWLPAFAVGIAPPIVNSEPSSSANINEIIFIVLPP